MFWSKLCKSSWNCAWNLAFPVFTLFISPTVWNMFENLHYESVYFKELHNQQEYYWPTIYRTRVAVVSTITSFSYRCVIFKSVWYARHFEYSCKQCSLNDWKQTAQRLKLQKRLLTINKRTIIRWNIYRQQFLFTKTSIKVSLKILSLQA